MPPGSDRLLFFFFRLLSLVSLLLLIALERDLLLLLVVRDCFFVLLRGRDADSEGDRATSRLESSRLDLGVPLSSLPFWLASLLDSPFRFDDRFLRVRAFPVGLLLLDLEDTRRRPVTTISSPIQKDSVGFGWKCPFVMDGNEDSTRTMSLRAGTILETLSASA